MAFAVGRVLSWSGFLGFWDFLAFCRETVAGGSDGARGGQAGEEKSGVWHDKYGYRHPGKEKQTKFRRFPPPPKRKIKILLFLLTK